MSIVVRVMIMDDVDTDEDLRTYLRQNKRLVSALSHEFAIAAADLSAMLKVYDQRSGKRRRGKVWRPLALASGTMLLVSRYLKITQKRFDTLYAEEIAAGRTRSGRTRQRARSMNFGG